MKLAEAIAMKNMEAWTEDVLVSHVFRRMGVPEEIICDQGSIRLINFIRQMCRLLNIQRVKRTPYRSHSNGQAERGYQTMLSVATADNSFK
ncbi:hypothetical protein T10_13291 [Trichinella papuae]|uniref:Integrase catalytic domain-containing protein n=1 Tax=Trichinella papuae TaxID=268474 RepID=A0A0V1N304_9BILA|nr:hypothetical protein T10_13291 [Trichinella papuae]